MTREVIRTNDILIRVIDFPNTDMKGAVRKDANGDYNVYLNAKYTREQNLQTYEHEDLHIRLGHLESEQQVEDLEDEIKRALSVTGRGLF